MKNIGVFLKKLFAGRLNRKNFFLSFSVILLLWIISFAGISLISALVSGNSAPWFDAVLFILIIPMLIVFWIIFISLSVRRAHDFNGPTWNGIILLFIPLGLLYLYLKKGSGDVNDYGNVPVRQFKFFKTILNLDKTNEIEKNSSHTKRFPVKKLIIFIWTTLKKNWLKVCIVILAMIGLYWFLIRPMNIKSFCSRVAPSGKYY